MIEQWRDIPGFEGFYQASDQGRILSVRRNKVMALHALGNVDYLGVNLHGPSGRTTHTVHKLILLTFVGPRPAGKVACHGIGGPTDNRLSNLRWDTGRENALDKVRHGTHNHAKKTRCIRGHRLAGKNLKESAKKHGRRECRACGLAHMHVRKYGGDFLAYADKKYREIVLAPLGLVL